MRTVQTSEHGSVGTSGAGASGAGASRSGTARAPAAGLLLAVVCAAIFFDALDLSITQIALPSIQAGLHMSTGSLSWVATAYVVTYGGFLLLGGRANDLLGSRLVFVTGLSVFGVASLACGLAGNAGLLVAARAVQGVGAALTVPAAVALLAATFPAGPARTRAFAAFAAAASSGFAAGLVLGGVLTSGLSWRWIFLGKVPAVAFTLLAAARVVPAGRRRRGHYDVAGGVVVTAAAVLLSYGVTRAGSPSADAREVVVPVGIAAALLAAFVLVERRSPAPLLPMRLLRSRALVAADLAALTVLAAPFGVSFVVTLYLQGVLHRSAWQTALTLLPGSVLSALVGRYLAPALLDRFGLRVVYASALLTVAAGNLVLTGLAGTRATVLVVTATVVSLGLGMGTAYPAATLGGVQDVDASGQGAAAGLNNTALQLGGGLGLALVAAAVTSGLGGTAAGAADPGTALHAVRLGALTASAVPLAGAVVAALGLPGRPARG